MTNKPSHCQNPKADCYREPVRHVSWAEDYTSDTPYVECWLCDPCAQMLQLGTGIAFNNLSIGTTVD